MAPHLVRAQSAYKDIRIHSFVFVMVFCLYLAWNLCLFVCFVHGYKGIEEKLTNNGKTSTVCVGLVFSLRSQNMAKLAM